MLDTNVVLDVLLKRRPFDAAAAGVFGLVEQSRIEAYLCATTITTIDYLLSQTVSKKGARKIVASLLELFEIAPVNRTVLQEAAVGKIDDFEDAVLHESARISGCQAVVARNGRDFKKATLSIFDPAEFLALEI